MPSREPESTTRTSTGCVRASAPFDAYGEANVTWGGGGNLVCLFTEGLTDAYPDEGTGAGEASLVAAVTRMRHGPYAHQPRPLPMDRTRSPAWERSVYAGQRYQYLGYCLAVNPTFFYGVCVCQQTHPLTAGRRVNQSQPDQNRATPTTLGAGLLKRVAEFIAQVECRVSAAWAAGAHARLLAIQWGMPPQPEWFDHTIDLYYQWPKRNNSFWLERGVFGGLALKGKRVLELSCGDGFNAKHFYSERSESVIACDFDISAITTAKRKNSASNVSFVLADIRDDMPEGKYENVVWDAAIEHFTLDEIASIMTTIKSRLTPDGILSGYTIAQGADGTKSLSHHEYEFKSMADLKAFLTPHFDNVRVFETVHPTRHNLYFWASDGPIPFSTDWPHAD